MQAALDGKRIERRNYWTRSNWSCIGAPYIFNWIDCDYRVAPELRKPREFWINISPMNGIRAFLSPKDSAVFASSRIETIKVIEVMPDGH
jgi:hypothetical protein